MKRLAIIGSGISGLGVAHYCQDKYDVTVFEANDYVGGHTATKTVTIDEGSFDIDTGFIVFNDWTYPNFNRLLNELNVELLETEMGFSVSCEKTGLEYSGGSLSTLFAQRSNLVNFKHWKMLADIIKFNKVSKSQFKQNKINEHISLGDYITQLNLSKQFADKYLIPMGAAIWSSSLDEMLSFPALYFIRFFINHGLLNVTDRPQWAVVKGGSNVYVEALLSKLSNKVELNSPVQRVEKLSSGKVVLDTEKQSYEFDDVVFACHSDQANQILSIKHHVQKDVLSKIKYRKNDVVLHTDTSMLPKNQKTWSSWNYKIKESGNEKPVLTYDMNILQRLECDTRFCVTLNDKEAIDPSLVLGAYQYDHPVYDRGVMLAQQQRKAINGQDNLWFCGAYWYSGFHEDGLRSALDVVKGLGVGIDIL